MKQKTLSMDMLKQVLKSEENKAGQLRNIANESYQEYQYHNLDHLKTDLLNNLITIAQKVPTFLYSNRPKNSTLGPISSNKSQAMPLLCFPLRAKFHQIPS